MKMTPRRLLAGVLSLALVFAPLAALAPLPPLTPPSAHAGGTFTAAGLTAAAGTAIVTMVPPKANNYTRVTRLQYLTAGTAHQISLMKTLGTTTAGAAAASGATSLTLSTDPGTGTVAGGVAASDWVAVEMDNGTFQLFSVNSVATLTLTLATATGTTVSAGNDVYFFGAPSDHGSTADVVRVNPTVGVRFTTRVSTQDDYADFGGGLVQSTSTNQPVMFHSTNSTAAGTLIQLSATYSVTE